MKIEHSKRAHALLSASGASRWMACPPSARLEEEFGEKVSSPYAAEGTLAHELSELYIRRDILDNISDTDFESKLEEIMSNELFSDDMLDYVGIYTDYCAGQFAAARAENMFSELRVEQRFDLTEYVPESFGTGDCCIISEPMLEIIDLKYGKGIPVDAIWNKQLMLYALGALKTYDTMFDLERVKLTIVQPRLNNISSFIISVKELTEWAETELKEKAKLAYDGKGELAAGPHCQFCSIRNRCRKLYEYNTEIAKYEFREAALLTDDEISDILEKSPCLVDWANGIAEYARGKAVNEGKKWPGFKLVEGRSNRCWADEDLAKAVILKKFPEVSEDQILKVKLATIAEVEKLVGKKQFAVELSEAVIKPEGKPTLVPESDKRPEFRKSRAEEDFKN